MSRTRFIAGEFRSLRAREARRRHRGQREREPDERQTDAQRDALPVPVGVDADEVARRRIEEEVALWEEQIVEREEERLERDHRDDADQADEPGRDEVAVTDETPHLPRVAGARTLQPDDDDEEGDRY